MMGFTKFWALLAMVGVILAGCSSAPTQTTEETAPTAQPTEAPKADVVTTPVEQDEAISPLDDPNSLLAKRVIYFDFDSAVVKDEFTSILEAHAQYLASNPDARVTLEGHADERGSREYNLGLGERRSMAVEQFLKLLNAKSGQLQNVSYGEERPANNGHNENAWKANRRVELVYAR